MRGGIINYVKERRRDKRIIILLMGCVDEQFWEEIFLAVAL